jgi:hypothetical protein
MPCSACGSKPQKETYVHTLPDGSTKVFASKIEANASKARLGGTVDTQK